MAFALPHSHGSNHAVDALRAELSHTTQFQQTAELFKLLGDSTRIRIFWLLCHREECVINLAAMLDMSSPAVSHHLRALLDCALLESRRVGKEVYYRAADTETAALLHRAIEQVVDLTCPKG